MPRRSRSEAAKLKWAKDVQRRVFIPKKVLRHQYEGLRLSTQEIAQIHNCSPGTVLNHLRRYRIPRCPAGHGRVHIPKETLLKLYQDKRLSLREIAGLYHCDPKTVKHKLETYGLATRTYAEANTKYLKRDFDGDFVDKAYLIGFRLGDLYVTRFSKHGQTICIDCSSSRPEQLELIQGFFGAYGHIYRREHQGYKREMKIVCYVNRSFDFLLPKEDKVAGWIRADERCSAAFAAGYIDAEGSFQVGNNGYAVFVVESCDKSIIHWLYDWLAARGVRTPGPRMVHAQGEPRRDRGTYHHDVWRLAVARKDALLRLIELIAPFMRHAKRCADLERVRKNVAIRNRAT